MKLNILSCAFVTAALLLTDGSLSARAVDSLGSAPAASVPGSASPNQQEAFQLGYCFEFVTLRQHAFLHKVKQLNVVTDEIQANKHLGDLYKDATTMRDEEENAFRAIHDLLVRIDATPAAIQWASDTAENMDKPVKISIAERAKSPLDLTVAEVMAVIDETGKIQREINGNLPTVLLALNLRGGHTSLWSEQVGGLTADLHGYANGIGDGQLVENSPFDLLKSAPESASPAIREALTSLAHPAPVVSNLKAEKGNLAVLVANQVISPQTAEVSANSLIASFNSTTLATGLEKIP